MTLGSLAMTLNVEPALTDNLAHLTWPAAMKFTLLAYGVKKRDLYQYLIFQVPYFSILYNTQSFVHKVWMKGS